MNDDYFMNVDGLLDYSLRIKKGEKVFIFSDLNALNYCNLIASQIIERGAIPFILWNDFNLNRALINSRDEKIFSEMYNTYENIINACDAAIMLDNNIEEYQNIPSDDIIYFKNKYYLKIFQKIMLFERWTYLRYPQKELADLFGLSYKEHLQLLEQVINFNYKEIEENAIILKNVLDQTKKIRIVNISGTDVTFTKDGINSAVCCGKWNLPDGEVYTAPEKYSMNGEIQFSFDTFFRGKTYKDIWVKVKNGKIIDSRCSLDDDFTKLLNSDDGSRYFGEFAFGLNPYIKKNYNDNLFNEKMIKTVHFAIGEPHYNTDNGNKSIMHWDLIVDMKNGGLIYFDNKLIQKDGIFIDDRLVKLNYESEVMSTKKLQKRYKVKLNWRCIYDKIS